MNNMNNIDDLFRKGTEQDYPVDDSLWAAVESQLPQHNMSKSPWFYNLNSIALLIVLITCSFIQKDNSRPNSTEGDALTINIPPVTKKETTTTVPEQAVTNSQTNTPQLPSYSDRETTKSAPDKVQMNRTKKQNKNKNVSKQSSIANKVSTNSVVANSDGQNEEVNSIARTEAKKMILTTPFTSGIETKIKERQSTNLLTIPLLTEFSNSTVQFENRQPKASSVSKKLAITKPYYNIELEALISVATTKTMNGGNGGVLETKRNGERPIELRSIGLNLIGQKKFFIYGAGIQQSQYQERFTYDVDVEKSRLVSTYDTNYRVVNGNYSSNGTPVLLIQQQVTENQSTEEYVGKDRVGGVNTIKWIGIPLFAGVQKSFRNWQASLKFSFITQYSYHQSGFNITEDLNSLNEMSNQEMSSIHFSNRNDFSLGYNVNEQFAVGARYSLFQDLNSYTKEYSSKLNSQLVGLWVIWKP